MGASLPVPPFFPSVHHEVTRYLAFDVNWPAVFAFAYIAYYYALEPFAAVGLLFLLLSHC